MLSYADKLVKEAKKNSYLMPQLTPELKNNILHRMAELLAGKKGFILKENKKDVEAAKKNKLKESFIDRLILNKKRIAGMSESLKEIALLPEVINTVLSSWRRPNGLFIKKVRVPIGVILIIYEARPNVTSDCIGLCFKSSNIVILRGGKAAINSNKAIFNVLSKAVKSFGVTFNPFFLVGKTDHKVVDSLLRKNEYVDLVIPRGGETLIRKVSESSTIPVIKHYKGICHVFVDEFADLDKAVKICVNAKVQRPSVCNAVETILVHKKVARKFLPELRKHLDKHKVTIKGDKNVTGILKGIKAAKPIDWVTEYLDLTISIKIVNSISEAINHINLCGSHHTDSIITEKSDNAGKFINEVDSACCFVNISTRFSDGYQFGLGAEIGISTDKLHARGPMGLGDLTIYKYVVEGNGQIRE